jgi:hypothetical protein
MEPALARTDHDRIVGHTGMLRLRRSSRTITTVSPAHLRALRCARVNKGGEVPWSCHGKSGSTMVRGGDHLLHRDSSGSGSRGEGRKRGALTKCYRNIHKNTSLAKMSGTARVQCMFNLFSARNNCCRWRVSLTQCSSALRRRSLRIC